MSLIKWESLRDMEDIFDRYTKAMGFPAIRGQELISTSDWTPRVDISEFDNELVVKAEIPDVNKEDVKVTVESGVLSIQGEKKQEKDEKAGKVHRIERYYGKFNRSFSLPDNIDETKIQASFKNGVLNLHIPKTNEVRHKSLEVKIE